MIGDAYPMKVGDGRRGWAVFDPRIGGQIRNSAGTVRRFSGPGAWKFALDLRLERRLAAIPKARP